MCSALLASMENALAMEVAAYDADDQAGHGESHHQNAEEGDGQDEQEVVELTTCVMITILFALPYFCLWISLSFFSLSWTSKRGFILFSLVSLRLSAFLRLS